MDVRVLGVRELNRATLARQMLLERAQGLAVPAAVERLAGMQAQEPKHPFIGLWSRVAGFEPEALLGAIAAREVVRATLMRSTLHLLGASDYTTLRLALQPPKSVALRVLGARAEGLDPDALVSAARELLAGKTRASERSTHGWPPRVAVSLLHHIDERATTGCGRELQTSLVHARRRAP